MNHSIMESYQVDLPEDVEEFLDHGIAKCIAFNRKGTLLAAGCSDGSCVIWDFITRGVAKELRDEDQSAAITSLCWSKCGRQILTSATDKSLTLWDVSEGQKVARIALQHTALYARLHPGSCNPSLALACPFVGAPILVDFNSSKQYVLPVSAHSDESTTSVTATASFNKTGDLIYIGNLKGDILIIDTETRKVQAVFQVPGNEVIRRLVFSKCGKYLLCNSGDSTLRIFENCLPQDKAARALEDLVNASGDSASTENIKLVGSQCLKLSNEFQNAVNSLSWKAACFSGNSEFVVGAPASKGEHKICIWDRSGQLIKILEGPKEGLTDLSWHPIRPLLVSVGMSGEIYIWAKVYTEKWSAFDPDFKEIKENEEYLEKIDESVVMPDINMMPDTEKVKIAHVDQGEEVDIMTTEKFLESDSDDSSERLYYLRAIPLPGSPEEQELLSQSDRPPALDKEKANKTPEPSANQTPDTPLEEPSLNGRVERKGRVGRKRKLPEKFEMQAEKEGRTLQKHYQTIAEMLRLKRRLGRPKRKLLEKGAEIRVGRKGRVGRKRKLPEKGVEMQAEKEGRTFQKLHYQTIAEMLRLKRQVGRLKRKLSEKRAVIRVGRKGRVGRKRKLPEKEVEMHPEKERITFQNQFQTIAEEPSLKRRVGRPKRKLSEKGAELRVGPERKSPEKEVEMQAEPFQIIAEEPSLKRRVGRPKRKLSEKEVEMQPEKECITSQKHFHTIAEPSLKRRVGRPKRKLSEEGAEIRVGPEHKLPEKEVEMQLENERITFQSYFQTIAEEPSLKRRVGRPKRKISELEKEVELQAETFQTIVKEPSLKRRVGRPKRKLSEKGAEIQIGPEGKLPEKEVETQLENERITFQSHFQTIAEEPSLKRRVGRPKRKLSDPEKEVDQMQAETFQTIAEEPSLKRRVGRPKRKLSEKGAEIRVGPEGKLPEKEVETQLENERITFQSHFQTIAEEPSLKRRVGRPKRKLSDPEKEVDQMQAETFQTIAEEPSLKRRVGLPKRKLSEKEVEMQPEVEKERITFHKHFQTIAEDTNLNGRVKRQRKLSEKGAEMQAERERRAFKKLETRAKRETGVNFMTPNRLESHPSSTSTSDCPSVRLPETESSSPSVRPVTLEMVEGGLLGSISKLKL